MKAIGKLFKGDNPPAAVATDDSRVRIGRSLTLLLELQHLSDDDMALFSNRAPGPPFTFPRPHCVLGLTATLKAFAVAFKQQSDYGEFKRRLACSRVHSVSV